jgi:hypothetical protein
MVEAAGIEIPKGSRPPPRQKLAHRQVRAVVEAAGIEPDKNETPKRLMVCGLHG